MFSLKKIIYLAIMTFSIFSTFIFMIFSSVDGVRDAVVNVGSKVVDTVKDVIDWVKRRLGGG